MSNYKVFNCDQFNVSDQDYQVVEVLVDNEKYVNKGDLLFSLESSKAIIEIEAEEIGYFYLGFNVNDRVKVGQPLYVIAKEQLGKDTLNSIFNSSENQESKRNTVEGNRTITLKAAKIIEEYNIDVSLIDEDVITERVVERYMVGKRRTLVNLDNKGKNFNVVKRIAFIGAGQGLIQALDVVFSTSDFVPVCIYDDTEEFQGTSIYNIPVVNVVDSGIISEDYKAGKFDCIIITVSTSIEFRSRIFNELTSYDVEFANLIHSSVSIGFNTSIGSGNIILANTSVGPCAVIGDNCFISAQCNLEHHNFIGNHCTFGPGVMTSGNVQVLDEVKFGTGVFIEPKIQIAHRSVIASGVILTRSISESSVVFNSGLKVQMRSKE